jgi:hypothetical protein
MSYDRLAEGNKRLAEGNGRFDGGVYRYVDADGKARNKDGYEAIWEEMHGRPVEYPTPRYEQVVVMLPEGYAWLPPGEPGVERKHLASFTERDTTVGFLKYASGAQHEVRELPSTELHFVLRGTLRCGGAQPLPTERPGRRGEHRPESCARGVYGPWTAFKFDPGDDATLEAVEDTETYVIGLPVF